MISKKVAERSHFDSNIESLFYLALSETNKVKTVLDFVKICWEEEEV